MSNIFSKLRDLVVGPNDAYNDPYEYEEDGDNYDNEYSTEPPQNTPDEEMRQRRRSQRLGMPTDLGMGGKMSNVIDMPGAMNGNYEVVLMEPTSFEEMPQAIQALRERKMVVLNLTMMEPDLAQRAVDFVAGGTYAMDGHQERVGESIFLFTPLCVQVTTQSGLIHEAPQPSTVRQQRVTAPTPSWTAESTRIAHSG